MRSGPFSRYRPDRRRVLALGAAVAVAGLLRLPDRVRAQAVVTQPNVVRRTLPNGLVAVVDERRVADSVAVRLTARQGSRDDGMLPGLAELTVLMLASGTRRWPSQTDLQRALALVGGTFGFGAGTEQSFLSALVPATDAELAFELLAEVAREPALAMGALTARKQTALQVQAQIETTPSSLIALRFQELIFAGHPASTPLWGVPASVQAITLDDVRAAHRRFWAAPNLVLSVAGKVAAGDALGYAERFYGSIAPGAANDRPPASPMPRAGAETVRTGGGSEQSLFRIGFQGPSLRSDDRYPITVLNALMTLRLFIEVRSERGLAYTAGSAYLGLTDTGAWYAQAGTDPSTLDQALSVTRAQIRRLLDEGVTQAEVDERIAQIVGSQVLADETNASRATRLVAEAQGEGSLDDFIRRIRAVTAADVQRVARTYLDLDRALTVIVAPSGG